MPERSNRQSKAAILIAALIALLSLLPALYAWAVRFMLRRTLRFFERRRLLGLAGAEASG